MTQSHPYAPDDRSAARAEFLRSVGKGDAMLDALPADASARRYFRLVGANPPILLMDAPPPGEDIRPFIRIARHLTSLGLSPPAIYEHDPAEGFALIEDFGDATFTRLMDAGHDPEPLFAAATDALVTLHTPAGASAIDAPHFDRARLLAEITELPDWYGPAKTGMATPSTAREGFVGAWAAVLDALPPSGPALVLLDYHVDNLMCLPDRVGAASCGLLDFQDARIGPAPYDLLCLLENERRGIPDTLSALLYRRYVERARPADEAAFGLWYRMLAAHRYTKVVGRFSRLTLRDGRDGYLRYLPRVLALLAAALDREPVLQGVTRALDEMLPDWRTPPPDDPHGLRGRVALRAAGP